MLSLDSSVPLYTAQMSSEASSGEQDPPLVADDCPPTSAPEDSKEDSYPSVKESTVVLDEAKLAQGLTFDNVGNTTGAELCLVVRFLRHY